MNTADQPPGEDTHQNTTQPTIEPDYSTMTSQFDMKASTTFDTNNQGGFLTAEKKDSYGKTCVVPTGPLINNSFGQPQRGYGPSALGPKYDGGELSADNANWNKMSNLYPSGPAVYQQHYQPYFSPQPAYHPYHHSGQFPPHTTNGTMQSFYADPTNMDNPYLTAPTIYSSGAYYYNPPPAHVNTQIGFHYTPMSYSTFQYPSTINAQQGLPISDKTNTQRTDVVSYSPSDAVTNDHYAYPHYPSSLPSFTNQSSSYETATNAPATSYPEGVNYDPHTGEHYYFSLQPPYHYPVNLYNAPHLPNYSTSIQQPPPLSSTQNLSFSQNSTHLYPNGQQMPYYISNSVVKNPYSHYPAYTQQPNPIQADMQQPSLISPYITQPASLNPSETQTVLPHSNHTLNRDAYHMGYSGIVKDNANAPKIDSVTGDSLNQHLCQEIQNTSESHTSRPSPLELPPNSSMGSLNQYPHENIPIFTPQKPSPPVESSCTPLLSGAPPINTHPPPPNNTHHYHNKKGGARTNETNDNRQVGVYPDNTHIGDEKNTVSSEQATHEHVISNSTNNSLTAAPPRGSVNMMMKTSVAPTSISDTDEHPTVSTKKNTNAAPGNGKGSVGGTISFKDKYSHQYSSYEGGGRKGGGGSSSYSNPSYHNQYHSSRPSSPQGRSSVIANETSSVSNSGGNLYVGSGSITHNTDRQASNLPPPPPENRRSNRNVAVNRGGGVRTNTTTSGSGASGITHLISNDVTGTTSGGPYRAHKGHQHQQQNHNHHHHHFSSGTYSSPPGDSEDQSINLRHQLYNAGGKMKESSTKVVGFGQKTLRGGGAGSGTNNNNHNNNSSSVHQSNNSTNNNYNSTPVHEIQRSEGTDRNNALASSRSPILTNNNPGERFNSSQHMYHSDMKLSGNNNNNNGNSSHQTHQQQRPPPYRSDLPNNSAVQQQQPQQHHRAFSQQQTTKNFKPKHKAKENFPKTNFPPKQTHYTRNEQPNNNNNNHSLQHNVYQPHTDTDSTHKKFDKPRVTEQDNNRMQSQNEANKLSTTTHF